jgi:hypothetical protein
MSKIILTNSSPFLNHILNNTHSFYLWNSNALGIIIWNKSTTYFREKENTPICINIFGTAALAIVKFMTQ